jgi:hypothetical protein
MNAKKKMISIINHHMHITEFSEVSASISLTHISNSLGSVNIPVILYNACAYYINVAFKEYLYLSLYNSNKYNDAYEFKNLGLCLGCEKEHNKEKIVGRYIKGSYYIKCQFSLYKKEIKINASPEIISLITH